MLSVNIQLFAILQLLRFSTVSTVFDKSPFQFRRLWGVWRLGCRLGQRRVRRGWRRGKGNAWRRGCWAPAELDFWPAAAQLVRLFRRRSKPNSSAAQAFPTQLFSAAAAPFSTPRLTVSLTKVSYTFNLWISKCAPTSSQERQNVLPVLERLFILKRCFSHFSSQKPKQNALRRRRRISAPGIKFFSSCYRLNPIMSESSTLSWR